SGTVWKIEPAGGTPVTGAFPHSPNGLFRAEVQGQTVRIIWNGQLVTQRTLERKYTGRAVVATVWQSSPGVRMTALEASSLASTAEAAIPTMDIPSPTGAVAPPSSLSASASASPSASSA